MRIHPGNMLTPLLVLAAALLPAACATAPRSLPHPFAHDHAHPGGAAERAAADAAGFGGGSGEVRWGGRRWPGPERAVPGGGLRFHAGPVRGNPEPGAVAGWGGGVPSGRGEAGRVELAAGTALNLVGWMRGGEGEGCVVAAVREERRG